MTQSEVETLRSVSVAADREKPEFPPAAGPAGGLDSLVGRFEDAPEFADELDAIVRNRGRRRPTEIED